MSAQEQQTQNGAAPFSWPEGKRAAISITFDDARPSQVDQGLPILDKHGVKATFYVTLSTMQQRLEAWREAVGHGHEIGNHTSSHPCSGNFSFSRDNALEDYTLERIESDILAASDDIKKVVGVSAKTFAFPCGQKFVGRGRQLQSYVPVVAKNFLAGRGFRDEAPNNPLYCDMAQLFGVDADSTPFDGIKNWVDQAIDTGGWLVFAAHDVGNAAPQTITESVLDQFCRYVNDERNGLWCDTVETIAAHVHQARQNNG